MITPLHSVSWTLLDKAGKISVQLTGLSDVTPEEAAKRLRWAADYVDKAFPKELPSSCE